jgi:hypothetical protein
MSIRVCTVELQANRRLRCISNPVIYTYI